MVKYSYCDIKFFKSTSSVLYKRMKAKYDKYTKGVADKLAQIRKQRINWTVVGRREEIRGGW